MTEIGFLKKAKNEEGNNLEELIEKADEKFNAAIKTGKEVSRTLSSWGVGLSKLARTKTGNLAESLYAKALDKFDEAIKNRCNLHLSASH